jgi:transcriptional regulator with XRE-family HTH domain
MVIQKLRLRKGWSQQQLAEFSDLSVRTIQRLEAGAPASLETLKALAAVFEVDLQTLKPEETMNTTSTPTLAETQTARQEQLAFDQVRRLRSFYLHVLQFVIINAVFITANLMLAPNQLVAPIVTLCWGGGLLVHALKVWHFNGVWEREQVERRLGRPL